MFAGRSEVRVLNRVGSLTTHRLSMSVCRGPGSICFGSETQLPPPQRRTMGLETWLGCELFVGSQPELTAIPIMGKFALCEGDRFLQPQMLLERLQRLSDKGFTIVLAHVERFLWFSPDCELVAPLRAMGALFQVNVEGVESGAAVPWLERRLADLIATDNHGDASLPGRLREQVGNWPYLLKRMECLHP